jgi:3-oxoacyl-[acyl-carrier-protein] synthase III
MALLAFENVGIKGISACVPSRLIKNYEQDLYFPKDDVKEIVDKIGVVERRFADKNTCSSDLCYTAAEKLITEMNICREEIDLLVFISQTPDFRMPATSIILQDRLKLGTGTIAFDINLGCSAFLYGLSMVYSMMEHSNLRKALILDGETRSKVYSQKDRKTAFLFGDAGIAALIERDNTFGKSWFSLNSDGSRESLIKINAGGYRNMSSAETLAEKVVDEYGNIRSEEQGYMNGSDVFNFIIREIPKDFQRLLKFAQTDAGNIDFFIFHQANSYINGFLRKTLKIPEEKVPSTIHKYGNTSSVSIPLTIASELKNNLNGRKKLLLNGFGVGLSWGTALIETENCFICDMSEI